MAEDNTRWGRAQQEFWQTRQQGLEELVTHRTKALLHRETFAQRWDARDQGQTLAQERERWQAFQVLVRHHDLTFDWSDDPRVRQRGREELTEITRQARAFPTEEVARVWDAMVDRNLIEEARSQYYWRQTHGWREERRSYDER